MKDISTLQKVDLPALTIVSVVNEVFSTILMLSAVSKPTAPHHLGSA